MGLAGAAVSDGDDILTALDVFTPGQFHNQGLVHRGDGQEVEGIQTLYGGETGRPDSALYHPLVAAYELQLGQPEQIVRMVYVVGGALSNYLKKRFEIVVNG